MLKSISKLQNQAQNVFKRTMATNSHQQSIDVHTHMYTPKYMDMLRRRTEIPRVVNVKGDDRLVILPGEDKNITSHMGRPIGREYYDVNAKLEYMDMHGISTSVISLANPWLDFLHGKEAEAVAQELNDELQDICEKSNGRLYGFATLPVKNSVAAVKEVERVSKLPHIKGVILGTPGAGNGLDHDNCRDMLQAVENKDLTIFLHPHYGVGNEHYLDAGHALFLALGFPFETTVCVSRLIVSGQLDKMPALKLLVAHAGAALPGLIGRLDSCVFHDLAIANRLEHTPTEYLQRMYFDAIAYNTPSLQSLITQVGEDRIMFGTDNPFFPPPNADDVCKEEWPSTNKVYATMAPFSSDIRNKILRENAQNLLNIKPKF